MLLGQRRERPFPGVHHALLIGALRDVGGDYLDDLARGCSSKLSPRANPSNGRNMSWIAARSCVCGPDLILGPASP
jgi:hypothetical protein